MTIHSSMTFCQPTAVIRDAPGKNPTVGKRTQLVVWGRSFLPEVTCDSDLFLLMYDLSNGFMRRYSPALCDESTEGLWHSSLCVFGFEYFFEGGIAILPPGCSRFGAKPHSVWRLGKTVCTVSEFHAWCKEQSHGGRYSFAQYHILSNNCNHFTHQAVRFLLGGNDARTDHDLWRGIARSLPITRIQKNSHASSKKSSQPYDEPSTNQKRRPRGVKASSTVEREPFATSVDYVWCSAQNIQDLFCYLEDQTQLIQRSAFRFLRGTLENTMRGVQVLASQQRINFISHLCNKVIDLRKLRRYDVTVPHSVLIPTTDVLSSQISLSIWCDAHAGMQSEIWHIPPFTDWCPAAKDDSDADVQTVTQKLQLCTSMYTQHLHEKPITPTHSSKPEQDDSHKKSCVLYTSFLSTLFHFCMGEGGVHFVLYLVHHEPIMEWITVLSESIWLHHPLVVRSLNCLLASLLIAPAGASFLLTNMRLYRGAVSSITLCIAGSEVFGPDNALLAVILMYNIVVVFRISVRVYGAYVNENHPIRMLQLASLALHLLNLKGIGNGSRHDYFVASFLCLTLLHTFLGQARAASTLSSWNLRGIVSRVQRQEQAIRLNDSMSQPTNTKSLSLPGGIGFGPPGESKAWAEESRRSSEELNMSGLMQQFLEHSKCRTDISPEEIMFHSASSAVLGAVKSGFRARQD